MFENELNDLFTKKVTIHLPADAKKALVTAMPWLVLVGGILTLIGVWGLFASAMYLNTAATNLSLAYGVAAPVQKVNAFIWVSTIVLLAEAALMLAAFAPLKKLYKRGWNLVYWLALLNVAYAVVYMFIDFNLFSLVLSLLASAVGLYLLFQIRSSYLGGPATSKSSGSADHKK